MVFIFVLISTVPVLSSQIIYPMARTIQPANTLKQPTSNTVQPKEYTIEAEDHIVQPMDTIYKPITYGHLVADAGADQTVYQGEAVILDGSKSTDDEKIVSFVWTENGQVLADTQTATIKNMTEGNHLITLTVTDDDGATASDTVKITVIPKKETGTETNTTSATNNGGGGGAMGYLFPLFTLLLLIRRRYA